MLDLDAFFHATLSRKLLVNCVSSILGKVYLEGDVVSKGFVQIKLNKSIWKLDKLRHVPSLRKNLILIIQLATDEYVITFASDS